jgi:hypothetical protein
MYRLYTNGLQNQLNLHFPMWTYFTFPRNIYLTVITLPVGLCAFYLYHALALNVQRGSQPLIVLLTGVAKLESVINGVRGPGMLLV